MATMASSTILPMVGCLALALQVRPAGLLGHPEDVDGAVFVGVFRVGALGPFGFELGVLLLEGVGDVLQEDQAEHDVLVLGGVHVGAERVGGLPQLPLKSEIGSVGALIHAFTSICVFSCSEKNRCCEFLVSPLMISRSL